jgi:hypothetical protein
LNHLFAPFVLKINVDIRRLVALLFFVPFVLGTLGALEQARFESSR